DARKQNLIDQAKELQSLKDQQAAVKTLLPQLVRLQELRDRSDQIDALGGGLGNIARKQMQAQLGSVATGDAPGMTGIDAVVGGAFGEMSRIGRERAKYQEW